MGFSLKFRERLDTGTADEIDKLMKFLKQFLLTGHNEDGSHIVNSPTTNIAAANAPYVTVGNTSSLSAERALVGTADQITVTDNGANSTVAIGTVQSIATGSSPTFAALSVTSITASSLTSGRVPVTSTAGLLIDDADLTFATDTLTATKIATTSLQSSGDIKIGGAAGAATTLRTITKKVTGIADNTATSIFTLSIPNGNHAATVRLLFLSSNGSTDAFESSRTASGSVVIARTTGVNAVSAVSTIDATAIATISAGATHTLAYDLGAVGGAVGAVNTVDIRVTIDDSGNLGGSQVVVLAELLNSESTGITIS